MARKVWTAGEPNTTRSWIAARAGSGCRPRYKRAVSCAIAVPRPPASALLLFGVEYPSSPYRATIALDVSTAAAGRRERPPPRRRAPLRRGRGRRAAHTSAPGNYLNLRRPVLMALFDPFARAIRPTRLIENGPRSPGYDLKQQPAPPHHHPHKARARRRAAPPHAAPPAARTVHQVAVLELSVEIPVAGPTEGDVVHFRASVRPQT